MTQREIIELIGQGLFGPDAELVETHISYIVLGAEFVYKIKKPVQFNFLDFSTLERRAHCCAREVELNRRLAPDMYLGVVEIRHEGTRYFLGGTQGACVDYAVQMRRMQTSLEMDRLLLQGKVGGECILGLAKLVADFHRNAEVIHNPGQSNAEAYFEDFKDISSIASTVTLHCGQAECDRILSALGQVESFLTGHSDLLEARAEAGMVRDLHGDLHTRNIFLYPTPVVFDCIEFNDRLRQIDVLNEVAFLCMDLEAQGFPVLATAFMIDYSAAWPVAMWQKGQALFSYFKAYRANVRAKIAGLRLGQLASTGNGQPSNVASTVQEMQHYLDLMHSSLQACH